jgi:hypothetical protein
MIYKYCVVFIDSPMNHRDGFKKGVSIYANCRVFADYKKAKRYAARWKPPAMIYKLMKKDEDKNPEV